MPRKKTSEKPSPRKIEEPLYGPYEDARWKGALKRAETLLDRVTKDGIHLLEIHPEVFFFRAPPPPATGKQPFLYAWIEKQVTVPVGLFGLLYLADLWDYNLRDLTSNNLLGVRTFHTPSAYRHVEHLLDPETGTFGLPYQPSFFARNWERIFFWGPACETLPAKSVLNIPAKELPFYNVAEKVWSACFEGHEEEDELDDILRSSDLGAQQQILKTWTKFVLDEIESAPGEVWGLDMYASHL